MKRKKALSKIGLMHGSPERSRQLEKGKRSTAEKSSEEAGGGHLNGHIVKVGIEKLAQRNNCGDERPGT